MTQTPREWQNDWNVCLNVNDWHEYQWEAGSEEGSNIWRIHEMLPDEPCQFVAECENELVADFIMTAHEALPYWLQEADRLKKRDESSERALHRMTVRAEAAEASLESMKIVSEAETDRANRWREHTRQANIDLNAAEAREQRLKETMESIIPLIKTRSVGGMVGMLMDMLRTLYPDTPAPKEGK